MTENITPNPSRRTIAKGAAWAVPAVAVAATAPALAASPTACTPGTLRVTPNCPPPVSTQSLTFTIENPAGNGCVVPAGTPVDITVSGLVGLTADLLVSVNAGVLFNDNGTLALTNPLAAGESITLEVFPPSLLNAQVAGTATASVLGSTGSANYIIATVAGLSVAFCA